MKLCFNIFGQCKCRIRYATMNNLSIASSPAGKNTINPIRQCTEKHYVDAFKKARKDLYKLAIGDPSVFGNLPPHPALSQAVQRVLQEGSSFGYGTSYGYETARQAVAKQFSTPQRPLTSDDVVMATGCSGALELSFNVLCEPGSNILVPAPGFTIYSCTAGSLGLHIKHYNLLAERSWEADLAHLESLVDPLTRAILINNPSNPCGSVYSADHLKGFVSIARKHKLPIIADETYANIVFQGQEFHAVSSVAEEVPVLTCGTLSKRYLVPGWRVGWVIIHDLQGVLKHEIKPGLQRLATRNIGPCSLIQQALSDIFKNVPESFFTETVAIFENNAVACHELLSKVEGLHPIMPAGAMYMMVEIDLQRFPEFEDDVSFLKQLIIEQGVVCLPGSAFQRPNAMRLALIMPQQGITVACQRISEFCEQHIVDT